MTYKEFSSYYREIRLIKNISQKEMAYLIPIDKTVYNRIENGLREPDFFTLQRICQILDIDLTEVLELKKPMPEHKPCFD